MRNLILAGVVLLAACGAESPAPNTEVAIQLKSGRAESVRQNTVRGPNVVKDREALNALLKALGPHGVKIMDIVAAGRVPFLTFEGAPELEALYRQAFGL